MPTRLFEKLAKISMELLVYPTTLYRARTAYQSEFHKFLSSPLKETLQFETIQMMEKGRKILEKHLEDFVQTGLCPNKCGLLNQNVINCSTCQYELRRCLSPTDQGNCGVHKMEAIEGSQVVLDCFLPWHSLVVGVKEYHYSWAPGLSSDHAGDYSSLVVTPESHVVLNQLHLDEQGEYRCLLLENNSTVLSSIYYLLTVKPFPTTTPKPVFTAPTLPPNIKDGPNPTGHGDLLIAIVASITALSLATSLAIAVTFGIALKRHRKQVNRERRIVEAEMTESL